MTPTRLGTWLGLFLLFASGLLMLGGAFVVFHRSERCVQQVLAAQHAGLSTWEAVERCQR